MIDPKANSENVQEPESGTQPTLITKGPDMLKPSTEDKIAGTIHEVKGATKEEIGKVADDQALENAGNVEKLAGKGQKIVGELKKAVGE